MTTLAQAQALGAAGFHVFELRANDKRPLREGWQAEATRTPTSWTPGSNVGIFTERFGDDGQSCIAIDVDVKRAELNGEDSLFALDINGSELPPTFEQRTPSGGRHLIYVSDRPVAPSASKIAPGIDIRSAGSYIVGPGSVLENGRYEPSNRIRPAMAPAWLVERAGAPSVRSAAASTPNKADARRALKRATEYLATAAPVSKEGEGGDQTAYRVAAKIKDLGVERDVAVALMLEWSARCEPPWTVDELQTKVDNAYAYGKEPIGSAAPEAVFTATIMAVDVPAPLTPAGRSSIDVIREWVPHDFQSVDKPVIFVLDGVIQRGHAGGLVAPGATSKTSMTMHLMCCVAIGREFGGHAVPHPGRSILLSLDDPQEDLDGVLARVAAGFSETERARIRESVQVISLRGVPGGALIEQSGDAYGPTRFASELVAHLSTIDDARLVVLDTLGQFSAADSSQEAAMKSMLRVAGLIAEVPAKPACLFLHHVAKEVARGKIVDQYSARGSAAITDNARFALHLSLLDEDERRQLRLADGVDDATSDVLMVTPTRGSLLVKKAAPFYLRRRGFLFETLHARPLSNEERLGELDQRVLDWIASENRRGNRPTRTAVSQGVGKRNDGVRDSISRLVRSGRIGGAGERSSALFVIDQEGVP